MTGTMSQKSSLVQYDRSVSKALTSDIPFPTVKSLENYAALRREIGRSDEAAKMEARAKAIRAKHARDNPIK